MFVVRCVLRAACLTLFGVRCVFCMMLICVHRCLLSVVGCLLFVVCCCLLCAVCDLLWCTAYGVLFVACRCLRCFVIYGLSRRCFLLFAVV